MMHKELLETFDYDNKGVLIWKKTGKVAGSENHGYLRIRFKGKDYFAHRLIWFYHYGKWPKGQIDHVNRNKLDNRIENLKDVSQFENQKNKWSTKNSITGIPGLTWHKTKEKWEARLYENGRYVYRKYFDLFQEAKEELLEERRKRGFLVL